jgi:patatin-like phospholipase/acyl hydrolase
MPQSLLNSIARFDAMLRRAEPSSCLLSPIGGGKRIDRYILKCKQKFNEKKKLGKNFVRKELTLFSYQQPAFSQSDKELSMSGQAMLSKVNLAKNHKDILETENEK